MNFIFVVLAIAFAVRSLELFETLLPQRIHLRDHNDIIVHILCLALAVGAQHLLHQHSGYRVLATAFLADAFVFVREFLVVLADRCKVEVLKRVRRL